MFANLLRLALAAIPTTALAVFTVGCNQKPPEAVKFKIHSPIPVNLGILKADGQIGRSGPISHNYRPQIRFPHGALETTCAVSLPASAPTLEPGQAIDATLSCDSPVEVEPSKREFGVFEGGKQVGKGLVLLP